MLEFNQRGLLIPETIIKSDVKEFKDSLFEVSDFEPLSL